MVDQATEVKKLLVRGLNTLNLTQEDIGVILAILETPENYRRMIAMMCKLGREPDLEDLLLMAELIRKY